MSRSCQVSEHTLHVYVLKWKFLSLIEEMKNSKISINFKLVLTCFFANCFSHMNNEIIIFFDIYHAHVPNCNVFSKF